MPKAVELSGRSLMEIKLLSQFARSVILLHTQEVAGSNPASRTICPRPSLEGKVLSDAPKCTKMAIFGP
jgi:hypothetical protein